MYCSKGKDTADATEGHNINFLIKHLIANAKVATVLGYIPASFDKGESEWRQKKQC